MKQILPKILVFFLSVVFFFIAFLQIFFGYVKVGKSSHQKTISMSENPMMFWFIVSIPIVFGIIFLTLGLISIFRKNGK